MAALTVYCYFRFSLLGTKTLLHEGAEHIWLLMVECVHSIINCVL